MRRAKGTRRSCYGTTRKGSQGHLGWLQPWKREAFFTYFLSLEMFQKVTPSSYYPSGLDFCLKTGWWWCWESQQGLWTKQGSRCWDKDKVCLGHSYFRCVQMPAWKASASAPSVGVLQDGEASGFPELGCYFQKDPRVCCDSGDCSDSLSTECHHPVSLSEFLTIRVFWVSAAKWWDLIIGLPRLKLFRAKTTFHWSPEYRAGQDALFSGYMLLMRRSWKMNPWVSESGKPPSWEGLLIPVPGPVCLPHTRLSREMKVTEHVAFVNLLIIQ